MTQPTPLPTTKDLGSSLLRTWVTLIVGAFVTWLARRLHIVLDADSSQALVIGMTAVFSGAYYTLMRPLESKFKVFGWFLGLAKQPKYVDPGAAPEQTGYARGGRL